ncbi:MAG: DinB family protein [Acidobacteria bacterium]|nr:DinB family protein [Acidobacteriota bacterium]
MLGDELDAFRASRARTLDMSERLSQQQMDFAPQPQKWSAGEVFDHLILADRAYRGEISQLIELKRTGKKPYLSRSLADLNASPAFIPRSMLPLFEFPLTLLGALLPRAARDLMLRSRLFPARNPDVATPRKGRPADEIRDDLCDSLAETEKLFRANPDIDFRELIHSHPLLGVNNVPQIVRFMRMHEQRHQAQLDEILSDADFPPGRARDEASAVRL